MMIMAIVPNVQKITFWILTQIYALVNIQVLLLFELPTRHNRLYTDGMLVCSITSYPQFNFSLISVCFLACSTASRDVASFVCDQCAGTGQSDHGNTQSWQATCFGMHKNIVKITNHFDTN